MDNISRQDVTTDRVEVWKAAVEQELQELVQRASTLRTNITNSKTSTKKSYYNKKFKKVQQDVMSMLTTLQRLRGMSPPETPAPASTEGESDVPVTNNANI